MTRGVIVVLLACSVETWAVAPPVHDATAQEWLRKVKKAAQLNHRGMTLFKSGRFPEATQVFEEALKLRLALYPRDRYPQGLAELAESLNNLAALSQIQGNYRKSESLHRRSLEMRKLLFPKERYPRGHPALAQSFNNLALLYQAQGKYSRAETLCRQALEMWERFYSQERYPLGHSDLANGLNNLAELYREQGEYARAERLYRRALKMDEQLYPKELHPRGHPSQCVLEMRERLYPKESFPKGHPDLVTSFNNLGGLYLFQGEYARAETFLRRALKMSEQLYPGNLHPQGHPQLALVLGNLAMLCSYQGEYAEAELLHQRAREMLERHYPEERYPQGHPSLAQTLNNQALLSAAQREYARAEQLSRRAISMYERLYPQERYPHGHPILADFLSNLATLRLEQGKYARAEPLLRRALKMREQFYPKERHPLGHPALAQTLYNLALLHSAQREYARAEQLSRRAISMYERLYPQERYPHGQPDLTRSIHLLAALHLGRGAPEKAEPLFRRALSMNTKLAGAVASSMREAVALNYLASLPASRDGYLSTTRRLPEVDAYPAVWQSKAALARICEGRHLALLAASSPKARTLWNAILSLRRERESLLLAPASADKIKASDRRLNEIDEEVRTKQSDLLPLLPELKRSEELARSTPADLSKALPANTALVDLLRYVHFEAAPDRKGWKRTPHYVAFVVTRRGVKRVELGKAKPIEELLELWRRAIQEGSSSESNYARKLHEKLWSPLKEHLPARTSLVHVSPDAALNRVPWSALLDGKSGRILLEEHAVAVVPHGVFLLDRLTTEKPPRLERPTFLVVGGLDYDSPPSSASTELALRGPVGESVKWPALPGSQQEIKQIVELARTNRLRLLRREGVSAGVAALLADLPRAQTAHLATHGFFADEKFRTAWQLDESLFRHNEFTTGGTAQRFGAAARSPMVLSGLVCSGANRPGTANRGVLTAEAIAGLDLRRLELAVLSACETGLGDRAGGEAVYGLVRGFHVAGARNVAASLWQVEDESTAALMVLFYRHLWGKESLGSAEALRRAQLALYREPARIKEWSQGRGPLPTPVVARIKPADKPAAGRTSPARAWAAFVLSGPGD